MSFGVPIETAIQKAEVGYKVLGSNRELSGVELAIAEQENTKDRSFEYQTPS
jgi:hypothetical protein